MLFMSYRLFISHAWNYSDDYYRLCNLLNNKSYFLWTNYSVPKHDPFETMIGLKENLKKQIRPVNAVIVLAGMYANYSEWIEFEIEFSKSINKPIIVIKPWGQERVPQYLQDNATVIVGWNTDSIVEAIRNSSI